MYLLSWLLAIALGKPFKFWPTGPAIGLPKGKAFLCGPGQVASRVRHDAPQEPGEQRITADEPRQSQTEIETASRLNARLRFKDRACDYRLSFSS